VLVVTSLVLHFCRWKYFQSDLPFLYTPKKRRERDESPKVHIITLITTTNALLLYYHHHHHDTLAEKKVQQRHVRYIIHSFILAWIMIMIPSKFFPYLSDSNKVLYSIVLDTVG